MAMMKNHQQIEIQTTVEVVLPGTRCTLLHYKFTGPNLAGLGASDDISCLCNLFFKPPEVGKAFIAGMGCRRQIPKFVPTFRPIYIFPALSGVLTATSHGIHL